MCGIFATTAPIDGIDSLLTLLHHRGPDSRGHEVIECADNTITLGHTRLAIQDLSPAGHQPMTSASGRWTITFNGEIYNHYDLRQQLNVTFKSTSDTETLVELIDKIGPLETARALNGIFGFAALDRQTSILYVVRDPYGVKPIYYSTHQRQLTLSSELKPVQAVTSLKSMNRRALNTFLGFRYTPSPDTLIDGIHRLEPGHMLTVPLDTLAVEKFSYTHPTQARFTGSLEDATQAYQEALGRAVKRQLLSDVPVGVLLSGGIDSALVASFAKEQANRLTGYTVGFGDHYADCEVADAAETAATLGIAHQFVEVNPESLIHDLETIVKAVEEPLGTTSIMAMWSLTQLAKHDVTVALTGQGSDEPWGGYRRYQIEHWLAKMPFMKGALGRPFAKLKPFIHKEAISRGLGCLGVSDDAERFRQAYALFSDADKAALNPGAPDNSIDTIRYWLNWLDQGEQTIKGAERMMRIDTRMNLADDLLLYGDKISMAFSLEARVPMLDTELMAFIESLPIHYRSSTTDTKIVHKRMAEAYLPSHIVHREKKGFQVPFDQWSKTIWRDYVEGELLNMANPLYQTLSIDAVGDIWQQHLQGKRSLSKQVFSLLTLALWAKHHLA